MRFIFVLQFDSFIRNLVPVIKNLIAGGNSCTVILFKNHFDRQWITPGIIQMLEGVPYKIMNLYQIKRELLADYQTLVIGSIGGRFIVSLSKFVRSRKLKTKIASGYIGALLDNNPKGFLKGLHRRAKTDLIWTPGEEALRTIELTKIVNLAKTKIVATGLPIFDSLYKLMKQFSPNPDKVILVIEQPTYPKSKAERRKFVGMLIELAETHPAYRVIIKPRFSRKVSHTHRPKYLLPDLLKTFTHVPKNISVANDNIYDLFKITEFAVTISSTGGLEALLFGIPAYFIDDFCLGQNKYGTHYFRDTGAVVSITELIKGSRPVIHFDAVKAKMRFDGNNTQRLVDELITLAKSS